MKPQTIVNSLLFFIASCVFDTVSCTQCNSDNCLRALFPTTNFGAGSAFCATFTTATSTATTGFPPSLTPFCGTNPSRYSSACSCSPTTSPSTTATSSPTCVVTSVVTITAVSTATRVATTTIVATTSTTSTSPYFPTDTSCIVEDQYINNGGFECALSPWAPAAFYGVTFGVAAPGHSGQYSYQVHQVLAPNNSDCCPYLGSASLDQNIRLPSDAPGKTFILTFWTYFYFGSGGFVGIEIASQPKYTVDAMDHPQEVWYMNTVTWVQPGDTYFVDIRFDYIINQGTLVLIDDVSVAEQ